MFFKNMHFYRFEEPFTMDGVDLSNALETRKARPICMMETACAGWTEPASSEFGFFVRDVNNAFMICLRRDEKVMPASVVGEKVKTLVNQVEVEQGRPIGRKERRDMKDKVLQEMLPVAFVQAHFTFAIIIPEHNLLVIDAASASKAEELIEMLRKTLGRLPVVLPATDESPEAMMTMWLMDESTLPNSFTLGDECELRAEQSGKVIFKETDITTDHVRNHIREGMRVRRLELNWQDQVSFIFHDNFSLHRMRYDVVIIDDADCAGDDYLSSFDADMTIMAGLLPDLLSAIMGSTE